jgi:tellurite resistance protein
MSIAELFESGARKEQQGAFRNLVLVARADGEISPAEQLILNRMATYLDIDPAHVESIMANPDKFPICPPNNIQDRRERMVDLVRMVMADGEFDAHELEVLSHCAIGLGYIESDVTKMVNSIRFHLDAGLDRDDVIEVMLADK